MLAMQTTTGDEQEYRRAGVVRFDVDGEATSVTLYRSGDVEELFLPFRDATSGWETYGAGRYLDVEPPAAAADVGRDVDVRSRSESDGEREGDGIRPARGDAPLEPNDPRHARRAALLDPIQALRTE